MSMYGREDGYELNESHQPARFGYGYDQYRYGYEYGVGSQSFASNDCTSYQFPQHGYVSDSEMMNERLSARCNYSSPGNGQSWEHVLSPWQYQSLQWDLCDPTPPQDPQIIILLQFFKDLHMENQEMFNKLLSGLQEEFSVQKFATEGEEYFGTKAFLEFLKKLPATTRRELNLNQMKFRTMQRSLSVDSPRTPPKSGKDSPLKLERFKVKTLDLGGGVQQDGQGATQAN